MIGLMDCNNFFVSCERLFRPDLERCPVAVLSSNDGCIVSRSREVKELGVPMGAPYFTVRELCKKEGITLFSSNFKLYRDISDRVMRVLEGEVGKCEMYSIDEAFFGISEQLTDEKLVSLRHVILQKTGIPVSIGVAATKTLAKISGDYAKKAEGYCMLSEKIWAERAKEVPCGAIWGIGRRTAEKLQKYNLYTAADIMHADLSLIRNHFGVTGERMYFELTGVEAGASGNDTKQSLSSTRSFHKSIHDLLVLESALGYHVAHIGEKLRTRKLLATHIRIIAAPGRYSDFSLRRGSLEAHLDEPTADTAVLLPRALELLRDLYDPEVPYKKIGFIASGIVPEAASLPSLFHSQDTSAGALYKIADAINARFGAGTVRPGVVLQTEKWKASASLKSPEYTTKWSDIRTVKAV